MKRILVLFLLVIFIYLNFSLAQVNRSIVEYEEPPKSLIPVQDTKDTQKIIGTGDSSKRSALAPTRVGYPVAIYKRIINQSYDNSYYMNEYIEIYVEIKCYNKVDNLYIWEQCDPGLEIVKCTKPIRTSDINETFNVYRHLENFKNNNSFNRYNNTYQIHYKFENLNPTESIIYVYRCLPSEKRVLSSYTITRIYDNPNYNDMYEPLDVKVISPEPQFQVKMDNIPTKIDTDTPLDIRYFVTYQGGAIDGDHCNISIEFKESQLDYLFVDDKKLVNLEKFEINTPKIIDRKIKYVRQDLCSIPTIWVDNDPWVSSEKILVEDTGTKIGSYLLTILLSLGAGSIPAFYFNFRDNRTTKRKISKKGIKLRFWQK
jgi:hypothetical protein